MKLKHLFFSALAALFLFCSCKKETPRVLVFSKTAAFRHESIEAGKVAMVAMGAKHHFEVDTTENDSAFYEDNLKKYHAVVFLNTTGDVLNPEQQNNFERFIQAGGGYVGIHSATDTEYGWPWYGKLAGAYFKDHPGNPNVQEGEFYVVDKNHAACDSLPDRFKHTDEFYNFKQMSDAIKPLVNVDEKTYKEGNMGENHPMSWYQEYDGGRAFYTAMGHTIEAFSDPLVLNHIWGGLKWALDDGKPKPLNYSAVRTPRMPEENRFAKVVLDEGLNEPIELAILPSGNVLFIERHGAVKIYDQAEKATLVLDTIAVSHEYTSAEGKKSEAEDGLLGVQLDPDFEKNNFIYFFYSDPDTSANVLVRYVMKDEKLDRASKKTIIIVPIQRQECCHTGGSIAFDAAGNLFVSTGDNTSPRDFAYGPNDERPGRSPWDAQKSSGNTNDLRGKILRIHPEPDGSYTIPDGNLFPPEADTEKTRPEIYAMGTRNPYRISVDKKTGYLYWGEVGPDANNDSIPYGSRGYDEVNQAKKAGNFGWPYFVGNNQPYVEYDFSARKSGEKYDPAKPRNNSPNNTGLAELPPVSPPFIWYPYAESTDFPLVGSGGRNAMAGPVFYAEDFKGAKRPLPDYYNGKLLIYEWMRGWIMAVTLNKEGNYESMEPFMGSYKFSNPVDMVFSKDGDLYVLEYGTGWFTGNPDARLVRLEYTEGNRKPQVKMAADKTQGAVPFAAHFSSKGTIDYDKDAVKFKWNVISPDGKSLKTFTTPDIDFSFDKPGVYKVELTVTDGNGGESISTKEIQAGNEPPQLEFAITRGNGGFFFPGQSFDYQVTVNDKEDGSTESGGITADAVSVTIDYLAEGFDKALIAQGHKFADNLATSAGKSLMDKSDCNSCHKLDTKSIGPNYNDISNKYKTDPKAPQYLTNKIKNGGGGVWGEVMMAAHPSLKDGDVAEMVKYILGLTQKPANSLPLKGSYTTAIPNGQSDQGVFILRAAYTDKGANGIPGIRSEQVLVLRNASLSAAAYDASGDIMPMKIPGSETKIAIAQKVGAYIAYKDVDLSGIGTVMIVANAPSTYGMVGGSVEVRLGSPTGELIGTSSPIEAKPMDPTAPPMPTMAVAPLKPQTGKHDVYFVCKNDKAAGAQSLMVLLQVMFQGGGKPAM